MCLAIPGKVLSIEQTPHMLIGTVGFGGIQKQVCFDLLPDVKIGEYVIVHVGFAISKMDEDQAQETLKILDDMEQSLEDEQVS